MKSKAIIFFLILCMSSYAHDVLDSNIATYSALVSNWDGPNCHQTTLNVLGILSSYRYVDVSEFESNLQAQKCQLLASAEKTQKGDIGLLREQNEGIVHSFVWINGFDQVYSKTGVYNSFKPALTTFAEMNQWFHVKDECLNQMSLNEKKCDLVIENWRCPINAQRKIENHDDQIHFLINALSSKLSFWVQSPDLPDSLELDELAQQIKKTQEQIENMPDDLEKKNLQTMIFSFKGQWNMLSDPN
jgi:hypothetical protein